MKVMLAPRPNYILCNGPSPILAPPCIAITVFYPKPCSMWAAKCSGACKQC